MCRVSFRDYCFLDLVWSCRSFVSTYDQFMASKLLVLIDPAVFVGQCRPAKLDYKNASQIGRAHV